MRARHPWRRPRARISAERAKHARQPLCAASNRMTRGASTRHGEQPRDNSRATGDATLLACEPARRSRSCSAACRSGRWPRRPGTWRARSTAPPRSRACSPRQRHAARRRAASTTRWRPGPSTSTSRRGRPCSVTAPRWRCTASTRAPVASWRTCCSRRRWRRRPAAVASTRSMRRRSSTSSITWSSWAARSRERRATPVARRVRNATPPTSRAASCATVGPGAAASTGSRRPRRPR